MGSSADFEHEVAPEHACLLPYIGSCSGLEPTFRTDGLCTHHHCEEAEASNSLCESVPTSEDVRLCPCYNEGEGDPASSYVLGDGDGDFNAANLDDGTSRLNNINTIYIFLLGI